MSDDRRPQNKRDDFKPEWKTAKTFEEGAVVITVHRSNHWIPRFRIELSFKAPNGLVRSLHPRTERTNGKVTTERVADTLHRLWRDAEEYAHDMMQANEDEYLERTASRGNQGTKAPMGLKALGKRDKEKREKALAAQNEVPKPTPPTTESGS